MRDLAENVKNILLTMNISVIVKNTNNKQGTMIIVP